MSAENMKYFKRPRSIFTAQSKRVNFQLRGSKSITGTKIISQVSLIDLVARCRCLHLPGEYFGRLLSLRFHQEVTKSNGGKDESEQNSPPPSLFSSYGSSWSSRLRHARLESSRTGSLDSGMEVGRKRSLRGTWAAGRPPGQNSRPRSSHGQGAGRRRRAGARCDWAPGGPPRHPDESGRGGASELLGSGAAGAE